MRIKRDDVGGVKLEIIGVVKYIVFEVGELYESRYSRLQCQSRLCAIYWTMQMIHHDVGSVKLEMVGVVK